MPRLPAEWEPQSAVILTWPHAGTDWADRLADVEALYRRLSLLIALRQPLLIVCADAATRDRVAAMLAPTLAAAGIQPGRLHLGIAPSNDTWARDHGPVGVIGEDGQAVLVDFRFNGWGGKYPAGLDDRITATLHHAGCFGAVPLRRSELTLEGGAIDTDGAGSLLAVRRTLLDPHRNPGWSEDDIAAELRHRLGIDRLLWLEHGQLSGDDTDGHIDTLARFCDPTTICHAASDDPADPDHDGLGAMAAELRALRRRDGGPYRLIPLPQPRPIRDEDGRRLPAGYANFLVVDGAVLMPVYGEPADGIARQRLAAAFPGRTIETLDCRPLIRQGGSLHCITMQLPAALSVSAGTGDTGPDVTGAADDDAAAGPGRDR